MATAQGIIERALRLIGATDPEETPSTQEYKDGLVALNSMTDFWRTESLMLYEQVDTVKALSNGVSTYTVGVGGDIPIPRPLHIEWAYLVDLGIRFPPIGVISEQQFKMYASTTVKSDYPTKMWYDPQMPLGVINLYPVPQKAVELHIGTNQLLQSFAAIADVVALPPGYQAALEYNLAVWLAPEYAKEVSSSVYKMANTTRASIKRVNSQIEPIQSELACMSGAFFDWRTGDYRA